MLLVLAAGAPACSEVGVAGGDDVSDGGEFGDGGDIGATPGGAQDIAYVRELIELGEVPTADAISVEGLLSEHDLPTVGEPCESVLCSRPALGVAPSLETGEPAYWLHLGMTSGIGDDVERPPVDLVVGIDKSSSMAGDMSETIEAVVRMVAKLRPDDRIAIFAFDGAIHELHEFGPVRDADELVAALRRVTAEGDWDIEQAARHAYDIAAAAPSDQRLERVMIFSCGYPTVSADGSDWFSQLVTERGAELVGLSFFGVLLGYDGALGDLLGEARGGSYYYLDSRDRVTEVFDRDFDFMVTPLAYDLSLTLGVGAGFRIERVYGVPGDDAGEARAEVSVATAFASRRRGGIVARLSRVDPKATEIGSVDLSYQPEPALGSGEAEEQSSPIIVPWSDGGEHYESTGVRVAAFLVNQAEGMIEACQAYHDGHTDAAREELERLLDLMRPEASDLGDEGLAAEVALIEKLLANMGG
jgi:Ca-activated chloride channel homolog